MLAAHPLGSHKLCKIRWNSKIAAVTVSPLLKQG